MPHAALREVLAAAGIEGAAKSGVRIQGDDPVLPIRYRVAAAASGSLAALGVAAARLHHQPQRLRVDARAAAISLRSATYLRVDGKPLPPVWDLLSGFYPVRDGWVSIHCNFPNHRDAALRVLGTEADRTKAEAASASWSGEALEDAIHAAGGCAGYVRSEEQWLRHPQAQAVANQPLLEIVRIGDAPPWQPIAERAAAFARPRARPHARARRPDLRQEPRRARRRRAQDQRRAPAALRAGRARHRHRQALRVRGSAEQQGRRYASRAWWPRRMCFRSPTARARSTGAASRRRISPRLRPGIVCASLSAWGESGPWRGRRGFDSIVQAVSGMAHAERRRAPAPGRACCRFRPSTTSAAT